LSSNVVNLAVGSQTPDVLQNGRYFDGALVSLIEEANRKARPLALMMFEIDHFKGVNDVFGREAGDQLLQSLTARVNTLIRGADILCGLGIDEFVILMPDTSLDFAAKVAERVRAGMQCEAFRVGAEKRPISVTISIGLAESAGDSADLLRRAEKALRLSKLAGRNRVFIDAAATTTKSESAVETTARDFSSAPSKRASMVKRKMAAIMAADVAFYSQLVADNEEGTLQLLSSYREVFDDFVHRYGGRVFNTAGDSVMSEFGSAVDAVRAAIDIQEALRTRNFAYPANGWLQFRIGITIADVVEQHGDLLGDGVNLAARLECLAEPGGICISRAVHEAVTNKVQVSFRDLGEKTVKNIRTPVHAFMVDWPG
jgi:diguanylate cyclase (GGDEF)-like protein